MPFYHSISALSARLCRVGARLSLLGLLTGLIGLGTTAPSLAQIENRSRLVSAMDSAAQAHAADSAVAGVSVAVARKGEMLLHEGYDQANLEFDVPMPEDAVFEVGSITKQFTATAILQLAEKDSLDLDAEITEYLPEYDTRGHTVTVRNLLYHTSGIRNYLSMGSFQMIAEKEVPRDTVLSLVGAEPFRFAPGTAMIYSNTGYFLLGFIIEEASGLSYEDYLETRLLAPSGMEASHYCDERAVVEQGTQGYEFRPKGGLQRRPVPDHKWPFSAGSLCSTAGDLVRWTSALHGSEILSDSMYAEMTNPDRLSDGTELRYGMGLGVNQQAVRQVIGHSGGISGFFSESRYYPETDLAIVVLQNTTGPRQPWSLADSLAHLVLGPSEAVKTSPFGGDSSELTGRYVGPSRGGITDLYIRRSRGSLLARKAGSEQADTLRHISGLTWRRGTDEYQFVRAGEQIVELRLDEISGHYVLRRVGDL